MELGGAMDKAGEDRGSRGDLCKLSLPCRLMGMLASRCHEGSIRRQAAMAVRHELRMHRAAVTVMWSKTAIAWKRVYAPNLTSSY